MSKFNRDDTAIVISYDAPSLRRGQKVIIKEIYNIKNTGLVDYDVVDSSDVSGLSIRVREEDLVPVKNDETDIDNKDILKYLSEDEIKKVCERIWEDKADQKFRDVFNARSGEAGKLGWCDLIISNAAEKFTAEIISDEKFSDRFKQAFSSVIEGTINDKTLKDQDTDSTIHDHVRYELEKIIKEYIQINKDKYSEYFDAIIIKLINEMAIDKLSDSISEIINNHIVSVLNNITTNKN